MVDLLEEAKAALPNFLDKLARRSEPFTAYDGPLIRYPTGSIEAVVANATVMYQIRFSPTKLEWVKDRAIGNVVFKKRWMR